MENQVFIRLRDVYEKENRIMKPEEFAGNHPPHFEYFLQGVLMFDRYLDRKREPA